MKPLLRNDAVFCPNCEFRLKSVVDGARCGICSTFFSQKEIHAEKLAQMSPMKRSEYFEQQARDVLKANEESLEDIGFIDQERLAMPTWKKVVSFIGIPVEEDYYSVTIFPFISIAFVLICIVTFLLNSPENSSLPVDPKNLFRWGGLNFLTYAITHGDIWHLVGNLLFAWPFMDNVEEHLGHFKMLLLFVISAVVSAVVHLIGDKSGLPLVGASGVCFAMAALYCFRYPKNRFIIGFPGLGNLLLMRGIRFRARSLIFYYIVLELLGVFSQRSGLTNVSHLGHLGGAITGFLFYLLTVKSEELKENVPSSSENN